MLLLLKNLTIEGDRKTQLLQTATISIGVAMVAGSGPMHYGIEVGTM